MKLINVSSHYQKKYGSMKNIVLKDMNYEFKTIKKETSRPFEYSRLSLNGHLYKTDTSVKRARTPRVGPCLSLLPLFHSL